MLKNAPNSFHINIKKLLTLVLLMSLTTTLSAAGFRSLGCQDALEQPLNHQEAITEVNPLANNCFVTPLPSAGYWMFEVKAQAENADAISGLNFPAACQGSETENIRFLEWSQTVLLQALAPGRYSYCLDIPAGVFQGLTLEVGNAFLIETKDPDPRVTDPDPDPASSQIQGGPNS